MKTETINTYPSKEAMIKYLTAFTPYNISGLSLAELAKLFINTFGKDYKKIFCL